MRFKNILCLTKVSKNQTQTERNENTIIFNTSKIEIIDNIMNVEIEDREVLYVASSVSEKVRDDLGKIHYNIDVNWVKCVGKGNNTIELPENSTDILIITKEIFDAMKSNGYSDEDIYKDFKSKGLGKMSSELSDVEDFSALVASIVE